MTRVEEILDFWFGALPSDEVFHQEKAELWFRKDPATDEEIRVRFGALVEEALAGGLATWCEDPRGTLALVLLLDQFTRNIYRDTPRAFAGDTRALALARAAFSSGSAAALRPLERVFLAMPLMHAEDLAVQDESVALFAALSDDAPPALRTLLANNHRYAVAHRDIIARFGRYPHRNAILGRASSDEEVAFLKEPGSSF